MSEKNCSRSLRPRTQARGVIPEKVSDLQNDVPYVSREELESIAKVNGYKGKKNKTAEVVVDNVEKTIEVFATGEDIKDFLPTDTSGEYLDGTYNLRATVVNGVPTLQWVEVETGPIIISPYYYGLVDIATISDLTDDIVKELIQDGLDKSDKEYQFVSKNQRQVIAYPAKFGELSLIQHKETGFTITSMFEKVDLVIDGVAYYTYISYNPSTGTYTYIYKY